MQISVPTKWIDWLNVDVYRQIRRIDLLVGAFCVGSVFWGWWTHGWRGAVVGFLGFVVMAMYALWSRPFEEEERDAPVSKTSVGKAAQGDARSSSGQEHTRDPSEGR